MIFWYCWFPHVLQKQTLGEVGTFDDQLRPKYTNQKLSKSNNPFSPQVTINNVSDLFLETQWIYMQADYEGCPIIFLQNIYSTYIGFFIFWKLTEWCCFASYLSDDSHMSNLFILPIHNTWLATIIEGSCYFHDLIMYIVMFIVLYSTSIAFTIIGSVNAALLSHVQEVEANTHEMRHSIDRECCHLGNQCTTFNNDAFLRKYPNLMPRYRGVLKLRGSKLRLLKSMFNAKNFIHRLSWSISSDFATIHSWNTCRCLKLC